MTTHTDSRPERAAEAVARLKASGADAGEWVMATRQYAECGDDDVVRKLLEEAAGQALPGQPRDQAVLAAASATQAGREAAQHKDKAKAVGKGNEAAQRAAASARAAPHEMAAPLARGALALIRQAPEEAQKAFDQAFERKDNGKESCLPSLGSAAARLARGEPAEALRQLELTLLRNPSAPATLRTAMGACHLRLGQSKKARQCFERALALSPDHNAADALLGCSLAAKHKARSEPLEEDVRDQVEKARRSVEADPSHTGVLLVLAEHAALAGEVDASRRLAAEAYVRAMSAPARAEACLQAARASHVNGKLGEARKLYAAALKEDPELRSARIGMGQAFLVQGEQGAKAAAEHLEKAVDARPSDPLSLQLLGHAIAHEDPVRAASLLEGAASAKHGPPKPLQCWLELGRLRRSSDPRGAFNAYEEAHAVAGDNVQASLAALTNAGAIAVEVGELATARARLSQAVSGLGEEVAADFIATGEESAAENEEEAMAALKAYPSLLVNLACLEGQAGNTRRRDRFLQELESLGGTAGAQGELMRSLDAGKRGDYDGAESHAKKAKDLDANTGATAEAQIGWARSRRGDWSGAEESFENLRKEAGKGDEYALVGLGAAAYMTSVRPGQGAAGRQKKDVWRREKKLLNKARSYFVRALKADPSNASAAAGAGAVLAEEGRTADAVEVFSEVEASLAAEGSTATPEEVGEARVNVAHAHLAQAGTPQDLRRAAGLYQAASDKLLANKHWRVLQYRARAEYDAGMLGDARRSSLKALHLAPWNNQLRHNAALALQERAVRWLRGLGTQLGAHVAEVERALEEVDRARHAFEQLQELGEEPSAGIDPERCKQHAKFCAETKKKAEPLLERARQQAADRERERSEQERMLRLAERKREAENEAARRQAERERQAQEERARANLSRLEQEQARWRAESEQQKAAQASRKRKQPAEEEQVNAEEQARGREEVVDVPLPAASQGNQNKEGSRRKELERQLGLASDEEEEGGNEEVRDAFGWRDRREERRRGALERLQEARARRKAPKHDDDNASE